MLSHLLANLAEPLSSGARFPMLWFDLLTLIAIFVVVMALTNRFGIFTRVSVICRHNVTPSKVARANNNTRLSWSRFLRDSALILGICVSINVDGHADVVLSGEPTFETSKFNLLISGPQIELLHIGSLVGQTNFGQRQRLALHR